jgi:methylglutaconyl-CoA hydratase
MQVLVMLRSMMHSRHINELSLTGKLIPAARALEMGIVNDVTPYDELDGRIEKVLAQLQASSPAAVRRGKQAIFAMEMMAFHEALAFAEAQIAIASKSSDAAEGLAAFNEKRQPRWVDGEGSK